MKIQRRAFEELAEILFARLAAPTSIESLYDELSGAAPGDDPGEVLEHLLFTDARIGWMATGEQLFFRYDRLFDGLTFTHRVTAAEIEAGGFAGDPGFAAVADLLIDSRKQGVEVAGPALRLAHHREPAPPEADPEGTRHVYTYRGDDGWLAACEPGRLCGLQVTGGDRFAEEAGFSVAFVPVVDEPDAAAVEGLAARLADAIPSARHADWGGAELRRMLTYVLLTPPPGASPTVGHASLGFDVIPPLLEAAEQAGLPVLGEMAGPPGFDWDAAQEGGPLRSVTSRFRLDDQAVKRLEAAVSAFERWEAEGDPSLPSGELFESTVAAEAFGALLLATRGTAEEVEERHRAIGAFAEALGNRTRRTVPLVWLQSVAAGAAADAGHQCELLEEASGLDPDDGAVGEDLGYCRVDQSRYLDAFELLERAGARGPTMAFVSDLTQFARLNVGRNEPCPCNSGRKFKQCHGSGRAEVSQADATAALYRKPGRLLRSGLGMPYWEWWPGKWATDHVTAEGEPEFPSTDWRAGLDTLDDLGVLSDILLSEGDGMARFVEFRQALLPSDEIAVAQRWAEVERGLYRVAEVDPETGVLHLEPVSGSDSGSAPDGRVDCSGDPTAGDLAEGQVIAARPLPVGGGVHRLYGGLVLVDGEDAQRNVAALLNRGDRTAEETARAFTEMLLGRMRSQSRDERILYFLTVQPLDAERREAWEQTVRFDRTLASDVRLGSLEDDTMVVVYGDALSLVSYTAERHTELKGQLGAMLGDHVVASELGVHADVLQEEVEVLRADLLDRSTPDRGGARESFDGAILTRLFETAIAQCLRANSE